MNSSLRGQAAGTTADRRRIWTGLLATAAFTAYSLVAGCSKPYPFGSEEKWLVQLDDASDGDDWPAFGRTYGEQHYSPLTEINTENVNELGLVWSVDLPTASPVTGPIEVDGVVFVAPGHSLVHAIDAQTGRLLWNFDPKVPEASGDKLRMGWGSRGIAYWNHKVITATSDGRLIALDEKTGKPVWTSQTLAKDDGLFISGAPRVFDGKVIVGNGGADNGPVRGFVTAWDADSGKFLWKFYLVPGNPADGPDNAASDAIMDVAAKTWSGDWWKLGGGGTVWNTITYDKANDQILLGVGNGAPWNHKIRSNGQGDNLFLASIVALDAKTGAYKWHYQLNPGDSWDFSAAMDMELADLEINGQKRQVVLHAPKNGFFYVIDRKTGKLISAEPFVDVTWAKGIDPATGRPNEVPGIRYEGRPATFRPTPLGGHNWYPMAFNPGTGLVYIPATDLEVTFSDAGITKENFKFPGRMGFAMGATYAFDGGGRSITGWLVAWDPVAQKVRWRLPRETHVNGGVVTTAGNLVFQGLPDGTFAAYDARSGKSLWSFDAQAGVISPPITYRANGKQYVTVIAGMGGGSGYAGPLLAKYGIDYRAQKRRLLTFAIGGTHRLPARISYKPVAFVDSNYSPQPVMEKRGAQLFEQRCTACHGVSAIAAGSAPDLRTSQIVIDPGTFGQVVGDGALVPNGMPRFDEFGAKDLAALRQYLRMRAHALRTGKNEKIAVSGQ